MKKPRTQEERRTETRRAILAAAIDALVEVGYARATTTEIAARAGVSQGALFKHFGTKADLVAAAAEQLFVDLIARFDSALAERKPDEAPAVAAVRRLWEVFCEPRLRAVYLLFAEAPSDDALRDSLRPVVKHHEAQMLALATALFPDIAQHETLAALYDIVVFAMQGLSLQRPVHVDTAREKNMLAHIEGLAAQMFVAPAPQHKTASNPKKAKPR